MTPDPLIAQHEALARKALLEAHDTWQQPDPAKLAEALVHQQIADRLRRTGGE